MEINKKKVTLTLTLEHEIFLKEQSKLLKIKKSELLKKIINDYIELIKTPNTVKMLVNVFPDHFVKDDDFADITYFAEKDKEYPVLEKVKNKVFITIDKGYIICLKPDQYKVIEWCYNF